MDSCKHRNQKRGKTKTLKCPNPSCGKTFDTPLKTTNVQQGSSEQDTCPYCLTKIEEHPTEPDRKLEKNQFETEFPTENAFKEKIPGCNYHLGYLSERKQKKEIPDECLVCKCTVECMLGKAGI